MKVVLSVLILLLVIGQPCAFGKEKEKEADYEKRMALYQKTEAATQIPWYVFAAVDQFEINIRKNRKDLPKQSGYTGIYIPQNVWSGPENPNPDDTAPLSIKVFDGIGMDGNGDGRADSNDDEDVLYTFGQYLLTYGKDIENIRIGLWEFYERDQTVGIISGFIKLFEKYGRIDLGEHAFPLPVKTIYSYRSTWGDARGFGGRRIHEGTDLFAHFGLPVRSTCYGIIEMKGWNRFGGWRVGIRDIHNTYHYFAHLNGFSKGIETGQIVEPGQVIGSVGNTGYGPPGTAGKFPPHLHYGMYKDNGRTEWSFDPYPHLKAWERKDIRKRKKR
ncbi:M23 family metallopeptidase [Bacillus sp. CLL-7-23]|uniref:M23 family metallopeptidase n=1 Tax=Bacillus changyiensis TaxID=3004103 RepID=A0ABT4X5I6_9BACI|nr:M23 family metallopeptidase [Bacillus changyiensis]MDA7027541.1 M23 family metallopeptidase [Bacillus changyiensis]